MDKKNQHIMNFFRFLQKKERREIPVPKKLKYFSDELTNEDIFYILYKINSKDRAAYFNQLVGEKNFIIIHPFGEYAPNLAMASTYDRYDRIHSIFIDKKGDRSVSGLEVRFLNSIGRIAYFNTINPRFDYINVGSFSVYGDNIALAAIEYGNGNSRYRFINLKGEPDITGIDIEKIIDNPYLSQNEKDVAIDAYHNQKQLKQ